MPSTPPLVPCVEQDQSIRGITPVYDLPEKYIIGQEVIELRQSHNRRLCYVLKELGRHLINNL
jgi:hypothetical protein